MSRNQSVGVVSYVDSKKPFVLGQDTVLIKAIHADWRFIYYTLQSDLVQRQIAKVQVVLPFLELTFLILER